MTLTGLDDDVPERLTPSALYVLRVLEDNGGWMTSTEIADETLLSERTVRNAVDRLREEELAETKPSLCDPRGKRHQSLLTR